MKEVKWLIIKSNHIKETTRNVLFSSDTIILTVSYCWITSNNIAVAQNASVFSHFASIVRLYNK